MTHNTLMYFLTIFFIIFSHNTPKKIQVPSWSYVSTSTLHQKTGSQPDSAFQYGHLLLNEIKTQIIHTNINIYLDSANREVSSGENANTSTEVRTIELIDLKTDSVYTFSTLKMDTILTSRTHYSSKKGNSGFNILQFRDIERKIKTTGFNINSTKNTALNQYDVNITNQDYQISLILDYNLKTPFNISITDENKNTTEGALIEMTTTTTLNKTPFKYRFEYTPSIPKDKILLIKKLASVINLSHHL